MKIQEISVKSVLSKSQVYDYTVNPYRGCSNACRYCYAAFMKRFTGHREPWGEFVDVKINAPETLAKEIKRKPMGRVWVSGVCDPYQPAEKKYRLTRKCLEILLGSDWPVTIQTKSPLVLRDIDILRTSEKVEVGFSITTAEGKIRRIFEPMASPISERINALKSLHTNGIKTFVMIAPLLPGAEKLPGELAGAVDFVLVDRLNYHYADRIYRENNMEWAIEDRFFAETGDELEKGFEREGIPVNVLF
ncbi:MAG: radical SAM protein [Halobacteriota archaeon]